MSQLDRAFDGKGTAADDGLEQLNAAPVQLMDAAWAALHDRLAGAFRRRARSPATISMRRRPQPGSSIVNALSALDPLDRLEVRGRDSAGVSILVTGVAKPARAVRRTQRGRPSSRASSQHDPA